MDPLLILGLIAIAVAPNLIVIAIEYFKGK